MSSSKRRSLFKGLFGRKEASQPSGTVSNSVSTAAAASTIDGAGASTAASAASANASGSENSAAALRNIEKASQELHTYFQEEGNSALGATKVYAKPGSEYLFSGDFKAIGEPLMIHADRFTGSVKAVTVQQYATNGVNDSSGNVLVVAIRGSVSTHDWMINLNDGLGAPITDYFMVSKVIPCVV
ncbi:hypothetical protein HG530_001433 [Fusarium avenaceum]|nr:hypothetical protein HG530_001433 [Fusarium avenaceum]